MGISLYLGVLLWKTSIQYSGRDLNEYLHHAAWSSRCSVGKGMQLCKCRILWLSHITITELLEQRVCMKFCQKLGHSGSQTIGMIRKVYSNGSVSETQIKESFRRSKDAVFQLTAILVLTGLLRLEHLKTWNVCAEQSFRISLNSVRIGRGAWNFKKRLL